MAYQIQGRFFSLRWRLVWGFVLLFLLSHAAVLWLGWSGLHTQLDASLAREHRGLMQEYDRHLQHAEQKAQLLLAQAELSTQQQHSKAELYAHLPSLWREFQGQQGRGLGLYRGTSDPEPVSLVRGYGELTPADLPWLKSTLSKREPARYLHCERRCDLLIAQPLHVDGAAYLLLFVADLSTVLQPLRQPQRQEFALIAAPYNQPIEPLTFYGVSEHEHSQPMFAAVLGSTSLPLLSSAQLRYQEQDWGLYSWPIDGQGAVLVLMQKIHDWAVVGREVSMNMALLLMLNLLLALAVIGFFANRVLRNVRQLSTALPLLAQSRFEEFRQRLSRVEPRFYHELDQLQRSGIEIANQLERQGRNMESYTQALQREVMLDVLTGLPGRAMFMYELGKTLVSIGRNNEQIALLLVDLDEFKRTNDTLGHEIGDELLKVMASRLQSSVRTMDSVCRSGSDEFAILIRALAPDADLHRVIHQQFHRLQQPIQLGHHRLITTVSIGVAFCDNPRVKPEELVKRADLALYQAKQAGRSNYRVFDEQMLKSASHRRMLEQELLEALQQQQLSLAMLPVVSLGEQKIVGFEALIRWHHPSRGLVMPAEFVREVDGSGSGMQLGHYVLEQAIQALARFSEQLNNRHFYVSVNLSPQQYLQAGPERLQALLERHQIEPKRLILELTEESLIKDLENAQAMMKQLKQIGVRIAVDDFGTGYSSLSYLKQLPFDQLKVDRGFVAGLDHSDVDRKIVTNVIELAHHLNRKVVAEGVESHDQHQFLLQIDCDYAQGYLFCTPLEPHQLQALFTQLDSQLHWPDRQLTPPAKTQQSR